MRPDEEFVARALEGFLGGPSCAQAIEGDDPPDLYLTIGASRVGVEVTRLTQFTLEADGSLGNRATQDSFGTRLLDDLNESLGPSIPDEYSLCIGLSMPVSNAGRFKKALTRWVVQIASSPEVGFKEEREIEGSRVTVSIGPGRRPGKKIAGYVANANSSADIGLNASLMLEDRIRRKAQSCAQLARPIWLALLNDYWLADARTYVVASRELKLKHCFERIFLVSEIGAVHELTVEAG